MAKSGLKTLAIQPISIEKWQQHQAAKIEINNAS